ncbi:bifunctional diguanylate cyclase/phosphodiesterase [Sulfurovum sp.]|uniref:putative bifunctional diguanylate cyclase/phosphodiesterase n=1 Tax=Sulfurovum sp. TaxID=1969726 RepID=UPI002867E3FD|nr:bifunctional diguanylate cyclase/phosphodiesterase [Sulfurovum sp.]
MKQQKHYKFLQKQILLLIFLSIIPGIVYVTFGYLHNVFMPAMLWYVAMLFTSAYGMYLYKWFNNAKMEYEELKIWYGQLITFMYVIFSLWTVIFLLYAQEVESNLHYIAIFTQLGASVVASTLLVSERKIFIPILLILMVPLIIYFALIGSWYGYILSLFSMIFLGVLIYASNNTNKLIEKNYYHAQHDALTGLHNRRYYLDYMDAMIERLSVSRKKAHILLIDLDYFKTINDSLGHDVGDDVLKEVSRRINNYCKYSRLVARLGGDEFIVVTKEYTTDESSIEQIKKFAENLLVELKKPYIINNHHLYLSASIGISAVNNTFSSPLTFLKEADIAMYEAKTQGRDGVIVFNQDIERKVKRHIEIEQKLYKALNDNTIDVYYQAQFSADEKLVGVEALVRWTDKDLGIVHPNEFIPIAENTGLILELGSYILHKTFKVLDSWNQRGKVLENFSINISMRQIMYEPFLDDVRTLMEKYAFNEHSHQNIYFEITEHVFSEDMRKTINTMHMLKASGISFSIDDFGTGYSSLNYLRELPIDELKIDKVFIKNLNMSINDQHMIATIIAIAKNFDLKIVAEGVETKEQLDFLKEQTCDRFQGFYFEEALDQNRFEEKYIFT